MVFLIIGVFIPLLQTNDNFTGTREECNSKTCFENIWYSNEIDLWERMTRGILADAVIAHHRALFLMRMMLTPVYRIKFQLLVFCAFRCIVVDPLD